MTVDFAQSMGSDHAGLQVKYQHALDLAIEHNPRLTSYLINDDSKEAWIHHFMDHSHYVPYDLISGPLIDQEVNRLNQEIEETCQAVFETHKQFSPCAAVWWDDDCSKAAAAA
jgi:hypothetical protein